MDKIDAGHKYHLFYGIQNGELRHISNVPNGLKCMCFCPACDEKLVARNGGRKRIHHFAHYESAECKYGVQTSIHIAAKQVLERIRKIKVPAVSIFINTEIEKTHFDFISHGNFYKISDELYIPIDSVILEKKLHKYIPDVVIFSKNKRLIIEIAVTHFVGRKKLEKIQESKVSAIEIDLSKIQNDFNLADLEGLIIDNIENKIWLYNHFAYDQASIERGKIVKQIEARNFKKWRESERERREIWYRKFYLPIIDRSVADNHVVQHIENCPLKKREYNGQFYANVKLDCERCIHSRGLRENDKFLICLFEYHKNRQLRKNST